MPTSRSDKFLLLGLWLLAGPVIARPDDPPTPRASSAAADSHQHGEMTAEDSASRNLFQSDMTLMTGMTPRDPMGGMVMPGWHIMDMGVVRLSYNRQGGLSGKEAFESVNWNMVHAQMELGPGRLSLMMMNSLEPATFATTTRPTTTATRTRRFFMLRSWRETPGCVRGEGPAPHSRATPLLEQ